MSTSTAVSDGARSGERPGWISRSWIPRTVIVVAVILPLIVALTYMWAMWDPTKYLPEVKLAVVNEDVGAEHRGEFKEIGNQVTENLLATEYLNFTETNAEEAEEGLVTGEYLFIVSIPEDFSEKTVSVTTADPEQSNIHMTYNDYNGSNGTILTSGLVPQIQQAIQASVTESYASEALSGLNTLGDGFDRASDGAIQVDEGMTQLQDGVVRASDGINQLDDGATRLNDGASQLYDGTQELNTGVADLSDGATRLNDGALQLDDGANQLNDGLGTLRGGTAQLADGAGQINDGVVQLTDKLIPLLTQVQGATPSLQQAIPVLRAAGLNAEADQIAEITGQLDPANPTNMVSQLGRLREGTGELYYNLSDPSAPYLSGVIQLQDGSQRLVEGTGQLTDGTAQLMDGVTRLDDGATRLNDGARQLSEGTVTLKDGTIQLKDGSVQLGDGVTQLKDGTGQLRTGLVDGAAQAPRIVDVQTSSHNFGEPIDFTTSNKNPVQTVVDAANPTVKKIDSGVSILLILVFGTMMMAILSILLPHIIGRSRILPVLTGLGLLSVSNFIILGLFAFISTLNGWSPANWPAMIAVLAVIAVTGAAIFQCSRIIFGRMVGGIVSLSLYALGLFSFGGIWPLATTPGPLRALHVLHPLSYARDMFVRASDGIFDATYWSGMIISLLLFALPATVISVIVTYSRRRRREDDAVNRFDGPGRTEEEAVLV